jgi:oligoribonuclease
MKWATITDMPNTAKINKETTTETTKTQVLLAKNDQNLIWLDCEMTGLDPDAERLIEIAVVVTGPNLEPRIEGPVLVIHQSDALLDKMDKWNKGTHGKSGLIDKVKASTISEADAEAEILTFLKKYVPKATSPLCGNTISQDRRFLVKYMPEYRRQHLQRASQTLETRRLQSLQKATKTHGTGRCT